MSTAPRILKPVEQCSLWFGRLLLALAYFGALILFLMMLMISADVILRNVAIIPGVRGLSWANDLSETMLYLIAMLAAPWLLRQGQHIRVDVLLVALPKRVAWFLEWICDFIALITCASMTFLAARATMSSYLSNSMSVRNIVVPEWWIQAPLAICFALLTVEMLFRIYRLYQGAVAPRSEAVSAA